MRTRHQYSRACRLHFTPAIDMLSDKCSHAHEYAFPCLPAWYGYSPGFTTAASLREDDILPLSPPSRHVHFGLISIFHGRYCDAFSLLAAFRYVFHADCFGHVFLIMVVYESRLLTPIYRHHTILAPRRHTTPDLLEAFLASLSSLFLSYDDVRQATMSPQHMKAWLGSLYVLSNDYATSNNTWEPTIRHVSLPSQLGRSLFSRFLILSAFTPSMTPQLCYHFRRHREYSSSLTMIRD